MKIHAALLVLLTLLAAPLRAADLLAPDNLAAWCIVPFDSAKRGPDARAEMLKKLGITKLAYDWRAEHIPTFDAECAAMKKHGIEITAWWFPSSLNADAQKILEVIARHKVHPQLWVTGGKPAGATDAERIANEAARIKPIAEAAAKLRCKVALYNHGDWFGDPENQIAIIKSLARDGITNIGIVYNFHHAHPHLARYGELVTRMKPHLLAVNINGMIPNGDSRGQKILNVGEGSQELEMIRFLISSGWKGPVGILNHRTERDAEVALRDNLRGVEWIRAELKKPGSGGPRPFALAVITNAPPSPAPHFFANAPLNPDGYPSRSEFVNRDRVYDFYGKQALAFVGKDAQPQLLPHYPGLDGGRFGHWGNQSEDTWKSERWAEMDHGSMTAGIFRGNKLTIPRAVCVYLGGPDKLSAVLDLETMSWPAAWKGGFVSHGNVRNGFMEGPKAVGEFIEAPKSEPSEKGSFHYIGLFRGGDAVAFAFNKDGQGLYETARAESGRVVRMRSSSWERPKLKPQWPQWFETRGERGRGETYALDTIALPTNAPWKSGLHFDGLDFFPDGTAALSTFEGEVWLVRGLDDDLKHVKWKRFAAGIHQGLGLRVIDGKICVLGRDQITRLHDQNGDDEADFYEKVSNDYETPLGGHDYVTGLERDAESRWYIASGKQGVFRTKPGQKGVEILATGFRNPNGVALGPKGEVICAANEGEWTPTSWLAEIIPGVPHYGARGPVAGKPNTPPTLFLPRGVDNSCGGQVFTSGDRWGVPAGSLVHLSYGAGSAFVVLRETVNGLPQGCAMQIPADFRSGATRARTNPKDGQLYVAGMFGWGCYTPDEGCFQRVRFTGGKQQIPVAFNAHANGVRLQFAKPMPRDLGDAKRWFAQAWNYRMSAAYGSDEYSLRWPKQPGHDVLKIENVHRLDDGRTLFIEIPDLEPCNQLHLFANTPALVSRDLFLTLNNLSPDFTTFPGYVARPRTRPLTKPLNIPTDHLKPVPWETGEPGRALLIQAGAGLQFAQRELRAKAGERISLTFENPDIMPHNFVLTKIGADTKVGEASNELVTKPEALTQHYVPQTPDVIVHTRLVNPDASCTIHFNAPTQPGSYPYLCTFPGHWQVMRGVLVVE